MVAGFWFSKARSKPCYTKGSWIVLCQIVTFIFASNNRISNLGVPHHWHSSDTTIREHCAHHGSKKERHKENHRKQQDIYFVIQHLFPTSPNTSIKCSPSQTNYELYENQPQVMYHLQLSPPLKSYKEWETLTRDLISQVITYTCSLLFDLGCHISPLLTIPPLYSGAVWCL